jgi:D-arabinose 1-dehydrogenase-like Zn-dependent alcohol dehydrogenase
VGVVQDVGPDVKGLKKGDRVGWGYVHGSCNACTHCLKGDDNFCPDRQLYGSATPDQGSFAHGAIWPETHLHTIPDSIPDEYAAPLQCAGATVFTPLADVKSNETVGVIGVGGLGHLAIQFAAKMGCRVVVLSGTESKKQDAESMGAHEFVAMKDYNPNSSKKPTPIDRLLITTSATPDWKALLPMMAPKSSIYPLTVSFEDLQIPPMPLIQTGISVKGSLVANRGDHRDMLQFAALHQIRPWTETFPMTVKGIEDAMTALDQGKVRFRAVLVPQ